MMPDFFSKLAGRTLEALPLVRPATPSIYAPERPRSAEPLHIDTDTISPGQSPESPPFSAAKDSTPSLSDSVATNAGTHPAPSLSAPADMTERKTKQHSRVAASPANSRPAFGDSNASINHSSREHDSETESRNGATRHPDRSGAGDARTASQLIAAGRERRHLVNDERSASENSGLENSFGLTSPEASGQHAASSTDLLVKLENGRARAAGEETGARASRFSEATPFTPSSVVAGRRAAADYESDFRQREESPPTIHVSIGRIEVRALMTPAQTAPRRTPTPSRENSSLEEYLRSRRGGTER